MHPTSNTIFWRILFGVLAWETTFSLVEILQQPIKNFHFKVFKANTPNKMDHTMWKSMKNCARKWCRKLCAFLFAATWAFGKMWIVIYNCILCLLNLTHLPIISFQPMVPPMRIWRGTSDNLIRRNYWTFHLRSFAKTGCQKNTLGSQQRETAEMSSGIKTIKTLD